MCGLITWKLGIITFIFTNSAEFTDLEILLVLLSPGETLSPVLFLKAQDSFLFDGLLITLVDILLLGFLRS